MDETWQIRRTATDLDRLGETESVFALGNGWVGWRGTLDEGEPYGMPGSYLNGLHERRQQSYPEDGYAFPQDSDTVISAPNAALIRLWVAGEPLDLRTGTVRAHERTLDLRAGVVERHTEWISPAGHGVRVRSTRLVSLPRHAVAAVRYQVEPLDDRPVEIRVCADVLANERVPERADDPRAASVVHDPLDAELHRPDGHRGVLVHRTDRSAQRVAVAVTHETTAPAGFTEGDDHTPDRLRMTVEGRLAPGERLRLTKYAAYECAPVDGGTPDELADLVTTEVDAARRHGFDALLADQRAVLDERWRTADVEIDGDAELQQAVRFSVFHLLQAGRADGDRTIAAKGLTGNGYDGHVLWDTESYVLPVLTYLLPGVARGRCAGGTPTCPRPGTAPPSCGSPGRPSRGAPSAAGSAPATGRPAPPPCTSTPTSPTRCCATSRPPATRSSSPTPGWSCWWRRPGSGPASATGPTTARSTSTGSPVPTSTPPWSTTTSSPT